MVYGYCSSTREKELKKQQENVKVIDADAVLVIDDKASGWSEMKSRLKPSDLIIIDSVSVIDKDVKTCFREYIELLNNGVDILICKQPYLNSNVIKSVKMTDEVESLLAKLFEVAFDKDFNQRKISSKLSDVKDKHIGRYEGGKYETKKSIDTKKKIKKYAKDFGGKLTDKETIEKLGISKNTYYKYKAELRYKDSVINDFKSKKYAFLSNFATCRIEYNGCVYQSVEAAYQAAKSSDPKVWHDFQFKSAFQAKLDGNHIKDIVPNWDTRKVDVMRTLLKQKFTQEPFKSQLLETTLPLIEGNTHGDCFWGVSYRPQDAKKEKHNMLGKLLMEIREELRE